jgi:long-chain acyl-CoA synthetase
MSMLSEIVAAHARRLGSKTCIVLPEGERHLTYEELDRSATSFAHFLLDQGCPRGGRLVIAIHNTLEFFVVLLGAMRAGVTAIPVDSGLAVGELQKVVEHADPHALVVNELSFWKLSAIDPVRKRIAIGASTIPGAITFDPSRVELHGRALEAIRPEEIALILYTSGTTGLPKGVMHSHAGLAAKLKVIKDWFSFDESFRALCLLPTHFGHGLICNCLATIAYGGTLVLCRPFDLDLVQKLWGYVEKHEVNVFSSVPAVVRLLLRVADRAPAARPKTLKFVTCASAPLRPEDVDAFEAKFGAPLLNCFGITETSSWTAFSPRDPNRDKASVGIMSGCEIRAVDADGKPVPPGEQGELQIKGPSVMLGYYKNPELTAQTIKDGWFCSGDHGKVDKDGRVFILGRIKELIIRAGLNVYPADVDAVLLAHPAIAEAYSVGLEDALLGEKVVAAVVRKEGATATEQEVLEYCRGALAAYKCPERIRFVDAIPKTSRGKVNRANLRPLFAAST